MSSVIYKKVGNCCYIYVSGLVTELSIYYFRFQFILMTYDLGLPFLNTSVQFPSILTGFECINSGICKKPKYISLYTEANKSK